LTGLVRQSALVRTRSCALSFEVPAPSFEWIVGNPAVNRQGLERYSRSRATVC